MTGATQAAQQAATRAANEADRAARANRRAQGIADEMPGLPNKPVGLPQSYWGDRQREAVQEFLTLLPIIESVANAVPVQPPPNAEELTEEQKIDHALNERMTLLLRARKLVTERVRREI